MIVRGSFSELLQRHSKIQPGSTDNNINPNHQQIVRVCSYCRREAEDITKACKGCGATEYCIRR